MSLQKGSSARSLELTPLERNVLSLPTCLLPSATLRHLFMRLSTVSVQFRFGGIPRVLIHRVFFSDWGCAQLQCPTGTAVRVGSRCPEPTDAAMGQAKVWNKPTLVRRQIGETQPTTAI